MKFKIRHKLTGWMIVMGLVPAFAASVMGVRIIINRLKNNMHIESKKTIRIGTNLLVEHITSVKKATSRLAKSKLLFEFYDKNVLTYQKERLLKKEFSELGTGILQVINEKGQLTGSLYTGSIPASTTRSEIESQYEKSLINSKQLIKNVTGNYAHSIDIVSIKHKKNDNKDADWLHIRAASPIFNEKYDVKGAVVLTIVLDKLFCQNISTILGSNIIIYPYHGDYNNEFVTSFKDKNDALPTNSPVNIEIIKRFVESGHSSQTMEVSLFDDDYAVSFRVFHNYQGKPIGILLIATDITAIHEGQWEAVSMLIFIAFLALILVIIFAYWLSRSLSNPIVDLVSKANRVSQGDLNVSIKPKSSDEVGELANAFSEMVKDLRKMQYKRTAQISEVQTLNEIINAISVQIGLKNVISQAVKSISLAIQAEKAAFFLKDEDGNFSVFYQEGLEVQLLVKIRKEEKYLYESVVQEGEIFYSKALSEQDNMEGVDKFDGELFAVPVLYQHDYIGVFYFYKRDEEDEWEELHIRILERVSENLGIYIVNAQLFEKISRFNEKLEIMVQDRTEELQQANVKLENTLSELKETQAQVLIGERLAGLGSLIAGVAHEINSPIGAIDASINNMQNNIKIFIDNLLIICDSDEDIKMLTYLLTIMKNFMSEDSTEIGQYKYDRKKVKSFAKVLTDHGIRRARNISRKIHEMGAHKYVEDFIMSFNSPNMAAYVNFMYDLLKIHRGTKSISTAIESVRRIVIALRSYSHVKQDEPEFVNIHDVIETSLIILANKLKHNIEVVKDYGDIEPVKVYGDELSQVWTNLILNASQAINGKGTIEISTRIDKNFLYVSVTDTGSGVPEEVVDKIFDAFFTTKGKGEGTGLGLGIVSRIVKDRHGGDIKVTSKPGKTTFTVILPKIVKVSD
ncbi:MAG: ATP-binding protein [Deltaproteobacteria bacterium]|jgi:signal transduction histidine kinase/HAMP domain-containing protein|nr:ATP-binding protein [Deltaproteobacteria bacterium]